MEDVGGNHKEILSIEKFGGYKTAVNERIEEYTSSREEEEDAQICPCGKAVE